MHFYRDLLGAPFGEIERHADDDIPHAHARWGSWRDDERFVRLNLYPRGDGAPTTSVLGFLVSDLDAVHERLVRAGVQVISVPQPRAWGRTATYRDPDGNEVGLTQLERSTL